MMSIANKSVIFLALAFAISWAIVIGAHLAGLSQDPMLEMKKLLFIPVSLLLFFNIGCNTLKNIGLVPTELEMALGLKDALSQGLFKSFDAFANPDGNPLVRFIFPGEAAKIEKTLRDLGFDKTINQATGKFTSAMSSAVAVSKPVFLDAVTSMTIKDAAKILVTDNTHAATDHFKQEMKPGLMAGFRPIIDSTIKQKGLIKNGAAPQTFITVFHSLINRWVIVLQILRAHYDPSKNLVSAVVYKPREHGYVVILPKKEPSPAPAAAASAAPSAGRAP